MYPKYIMQAVRQNLGLEDENDTSRDEEINKMSHNEILTRVCNWEGLINYGTEILSWVKDIYGVRLE